MPRKAATRQTSAPKRTPPRKPAHAIATQDVAGLLDAAQHAAAPRHRRHARAQLVLHRGAKPRTQGDLRRAVVDDAGLLEWKGPDRAIVTVRDAAHLAAVRTGLTRIVRSWAAQVT